MRVRLSLPVFFLLLSAACGSASQAVAPSQVVQSTQPPSVQQPAASTSQPAPTDTLTPAPSATATITPSPTPPPILAVNLQTLGQMRQLWTMSAPGSGSAITNVQCQSTSCDMLTRIGAYAFSPDGSLLAVAVCKDKPTEDKSGGSGKVFACPAGGEVQLYPALTGGAHDSLAIDGFPRALAFDPTGKTLAVGTSDGHIDLWDLASKQKVLTLQHPTKRFGDLPGVLPGWHPVALARRRAGRCLGSGQGNEPQGHDRIWSHVI